MHQTTQDTEIMQPYQINKFAYAVMPWTHSLLIPLIHTLGQQACMSHTMHFTTVAPNTLKYELAPIRPLTQFSFVYEFLNFHFSLEALLPSPQYIQALLPSPEYIPHFLLRYI